ncbi:ABC transporter substrate-binding protein [Rhodococcus sp. HNM0569]|uniref:ABC transporter substrate-binding protein n=1 Tax=Rhodococcus sp. HNM0569 TaxID=2716340 RepID=UPI003211D161
MNPAGVRRRIGALLAAAVLVTGLAACGSDEDTTSGATDSSDVAAGAYPVTVSGKFGDATIDAQPVRALPLSPQDADILLSLGIVPIAMPTDQQNLAATGGTGIFPWEEEALGGERPEQLQLQNAASAAEKIAALEPDVIVSTGFWGLDQATYDQLSAQVPVVHFDSKANGEPWQDSTRKVAQALGIPGKADEVIAAAEAKAADARAADPQFAGKTYNALIGDLGGGQMAVLASDERGIGQFVSSLGLVLAPYATTLPVDADGRGMVSYENLGDLDADVVFVVTRTDDMGDYTKFEAWNGLPAVQRGSVVQLARTSGLPNALGFPSALSLSWATDQVVPTISTALAAE